MKITQDGSEDIDQYYVNNPRQLTPSEASYKPKWYKFTPYNIKETINWAIKMLVLPGAISILIIVYVTFQMYDNLVLQFTSSVLTVISTFLIWIYLREQALEELHKIPRSKLLKEGLTRNLNPIEDTKLTIGFVGDIMMMRGFKVKFHPDVKKFFDNVDLIVCNLEGIIPKQENHSFAKQSHIEEILSQLRPLLKNNVKWLVCVSNNHSIDFGNTKFLDSIDIIQKPTKPQNRDKFKAFGRNDVPKVFIDDKFCISTATNWSNQKKWTCISRFDDCFLEDYYCKDKFNILYPHWGYENERYTRKKIQKIATELLTRNSLQIPEVNKKKWDLIFGHHPHTRQPVMKVKGERMMKLDGTPLRDNRDNIVVLKKLVAFSGGNFTSGVTFFRRKKHIHGIVMKCKIGPLSNGRYAVGEVEWWNTFNEIDRNSQQDTKIVKFGEGITGRSRFFIVIVAIVAIFLILLPWLLDLFG